MEVNKFAIGEKFNNVNELLIDGISVSDPTFIAEELNDYFISIGSKLASEYENEASTNVDDLSVNYTFNQSSDTFLKFSPIHVDSVDMLIHVDKRPKIM